MLARYCVCVSHVGVLSKRLDESRWLLARASFLLPFLHGDKRNSGISKKIIVGPTSLWNFVPNSGFRKFCFCLSAVETCYQLSWTRLVRDKLDPTSKCDIPLHRHGPDPTKVRGLVGDPDSDKVWSGPPSGIWMTIPLSYDSRPLVYCSRLNQQALSTARFRRAGLLATSESCIVQPPFSSHKRL